MLIGRGAGWRPRLRALALTLLVVGLAGVPAGAQEGSGLCARFGPPATPGTIANAELTEVSGLAGSRAHAGVLWTHNDSGGDPELFAMAEDGADLGAYAVPGATATDWEDMAVGPGPSSGGSYLYIGDIGDNGAERPSVTVYRTAEPAAPPTGEGGTLTGTETFEVRYPDGPADAEALLVDPQTGDLLIVTKSYVGASHVLRAPAASLVDGATVTMLDEGLLAARSAGPAAAVTGGDISPDGSIVLLRTYGSVLAFAREGGETVAEALLGDSCVAPQVVEPQGEALAFTGTGDAYVTASEGSGVPIHRVAAAPATSPTTAPDAGTPPTTTASPDAPDGSSNGVGPVIAVGAGLVLAAGVGIVLWRRRTADRADQGAQ